MSLPLHSIEQARASLQALLDPVRQKIRLDLSAAVGCTLAGDLFARLDMPQWDNSAMDGYAFNSLDLDTTNPVLPLDGCTAAGDSPIPLRAGHCRQIFTGAPVPVGADSVVPLENCQSSAGQVHFRQWAVGRNIRRQAEEVHAGALLLKAGTRLDARHTGLLAAQGFAQLEVYRPLRIGLFSSGNEITTPGQPLRPGGIYDANRFLLSSLLTGWGLRVTDYPRLPDNLQGTTELLQAAATEQDLLISSAGVSVGDADVLKRAVDQLGELHLWRVAIQPGKPLAFGRIADTPWIGLPGNPAAALITCLIIVRQALLSAPGIAIEPPCEIRLPAAFSLEAPHSRTRYLQARLLTGERGTTVALHARQSSAMLGNTCESDGLAVIPADLTISQGQLVGFLPYAGLLV